MAITILGIVALALGVLAWLVFAPKSSRMPWHVNTSQKVVALTFDDGPNEPYTSQIADIIESYGGKATFFVVGKNCERFPGVAKNMQDRGHLIGAHSYRHAFHRYIVDPFYSGEIAEAKQVLATQGIATRYFRFPWLFRTPWLLRSVMKHGYYMPISGLFSHPFEPFQINADKIVQRTLKLVRPGTIIIFHDGFNAKAVPRLQTVEAVRKITAALANDGYRFVTVEELLSIKD